MYFTLYFWHILLCVFAVFHWVFLWCFTSYFVLNYKTRHFLYLTNYKDTSFNFFYRSGPISSPPSPQAYCKQPSPKKTDIFTPSTCKVSANKYPTLQLQSCKVQIIPCVLTKKNFLYTNNTNQLPQNNTKNINVLTQLCKLCNPLFSQSRRSFFLKK
jgi:hypothetical protein